MLIFLSRLSKTGAAKKATLAEHQKFLMDLDSFDLAMAKKDSAAATVRLATLRTTCNLTGSLLRYC